MAKERQCLTVLACGLVMTLTPTSALSQSAPRALNEEERRHIEQLLEELKAERNSFNARIDALESKLTAPHCAQWTNTASRTKCQAA
jgi:hypothetical protein